MERKRLRKCFFVFIFILHLGFCGCASNWSKKTDDQIIMGWSEYSWGRALAMDVVLTGGFTSLRTANQREAIKLELQKRGYIYDGQKWIKEKKEIEMEKLESKVSDFPPKHQVAPPRKPVSTTPAAPSPGAVDIITVRWTSANIRSGAGNEFPVVTTVKQGDKLTVIGESGDWFNVRLEKGQEGWISNRVVK